jgi:LemA protein
VEPSERVARMEADKVITPEQASMLHESLHRGHDNDPGTGPQPLGHRRNWLPWILLAVVALAVVGLALMTTGTNGVGPAVQDVTQTLNQPGGYGEMNRTFSAVLAVALLLVIPLLLWIWLHNSLVTKEEKVFEAWAQTESNFQRRADLVPALVETVSRYLKHESETLTGIAQARGLAAERMTSAVDELIRAQKESSESLHQAGREAVEREDLLQRLYESQDRVARTMGNVFAVAESYPELRSSDQFLELQAQLEGSENRINVARMRFNDAVRDFNATARKLPWSLVAGLGNFQRKAYFRSEKEAHTAPGLKF